MVHTDIYYLTLIYKVLCYLEKIIRLGFYNLWNYIWLLFLLRVAALVFFSLNAGATLKACMIKINPWTTR